MDIRNLISSQDKVQRINDMQLQQEVYYNFINSIDCEKARSFTSLLKISCSRRTWNSATGTSSIHVQSSRSFWYYFILCMHLLSVLQDSAWWSWYHYGCHTWFMRPN